MKVNFRKASELYINLKGTALLGRGVENQKEEDIEPMY